MQDIMGIPVPSSEHIYKPAPVLKAGHHGRCTIHSVYTCLHCLAVVYVDWDLCDTHIFSCML